MGVCALTASFLVLYGGFLLAAIFLLAATGVAFVWLLERKDKTKLAVAFVIASVFLLIAVKLGAAFATAEHEYNTLNGKTAKISGYAEKTVYEGNGSRALAVRIEKSSLPAAEGCLAYTYFFTTETPIPGDRIEAEMSFSVSDNQSRRTLLGNGYSLIATAKDFRRLEGKAFTPWRAVHYIREAVLEAVDSQTSGEEAAVLKALIIGDPSDISASFNQSVKNTGLSHLLVVSGMHLGLLCGIVFAIIQKRSSRPLYFAFGTATVLFIGVICLFQASILRASLTYIIMLVSRYFLKNYDSLSSLGLGITITVLINPFIFYSAAFMLSVTATFAVIYPATMLIDSVSFHRFKGALQKLFKYAYGVLALSVPSLICTLPVVVYYFGYAPLIAPIANLLVELSMNGALVVGVAAVLIWFVPVVGKVLSIPFFELSRILVRYFISAVEILGESGAGVLKIASSSHGYCFFIAVAFVIIVKLYHDKQILRKEKYRFARRQNTQIIY